ncbi:hypothetical protein ABK040_011987 [Willaertia magna]
MLSPQTNTYRNLNQNLALAKAKAISRQDPVFNQLEYLIRLSLGSVSSTICRLYSLREISETREYLQKTKGEELIDVWINLNGDELGDDNSLENIITRGFTIPTNGLRVSSGHILLESNTLQNNTSLFNQSLNNSENISSPNQTKPKVFKLLHCLVNPGKCFCVEANKGTVIIPATYDSIYIQPNEQDNSFCHQFVIFDSSRIFADYVLFVEYDPEGDQKLKSTQAYSNFFNPFDNIINDAYKRAKESVNGGDLTYSSPNEALDLNAKQQFYIKRVEKEIQNVEKRRQEICLNATEMETYLREGFKKALVNLHDITQLKLSELLTVETNLRKKVEEVEWIDQFIEYQKNMQSPLHFLDSFSQHTNLKKEKQESMEMCLTQSQKVLNMVAPDIKAHAVFAVKSNTQPLQENFKKIDLENYEKEEEFNDDFDTSFAKKREIGVAIDDSHLLNNKVNTDCKMQ